MLTPETLRKMAATEIGHAPPWDNITTVEEQFAYERAQARASAFREVAAMLEAEHARRTLYRCASPRCPGYSYRASDMAHPLETCGPLLFAFLKAEG